MALISLIAAVAENGVIGAANKMPWSISTDLKFFRSITMGKAIIMGRKTFLSIGKALPGRRNIIISRDTSFQANCTEVVASVEAALALCQSASPDGHEYARDEVMVIGGGQIYQYAMPLAEKLYITRVLATPEGDTYFPEISLENWDLEETRCFERGAKDSADTRLEIYRRKNGS
ncbi:dihydrofolate reductase [Polycladidibacter stylochi]|uniref:dihydrofolate reductase n=1 Tax=Polycladidibacter stylochi TaxID=1807766 RepID=UPI000832BF61|nr:dihydrofolate reductase [Pseudovibrio stylochi]